MEAAVAVGVLDELIALTVVLIAPAHVAVHVLGEIVLIHEIIAGVVGWVDVDHLHLAKVRFPQELEHVQIVALDIQILAVPAAGRAVAPNAVRLYRSQRRRNGRIRRQHRLLLIRPCELIAFFTPVHHVRVDLLHQNILVNRPHHFARGLVNRLRNRIRKKRRQLFEVLIR